MKKIIKKALVFILTLGVFGIYTLYSNQSVNTVYADNISQSTAISDLFPDENLANVIAETLNKSEITDMVTQTELDSIISISAYSKNISSIEGLNYLNNLDEIYMYNNLISDLTPITNLTNLTKITFNYNLIYDITPLSNLGELLDISISNNQIEDISPVSTLNKLTRLEIANNNISDLSPLYGMSFSTLKVMTLTGNQLDSVELFNRSYFPILSDLWLNNNKVSDITPLQNLPMLEYLSFNNNEVENIEPLTHLSNLKYVWGIGNRIFDVSPINQFTDLNIKSFQDQTIILSPIDYNSDIEIEYPIIGYSGSLLQPSEISNNGTLDNNKIKWNDLDINIEELEITFSETWSDNGALNGRFSGTVIQPINAPIKYSITYDLDGGINNTSNPSEYVYGIGVSSFAQPTKEGYTFIGWFDSSDTEITNISSTDSGNKELYAKWSIDVPVKDEYTVTFDSHGGSVVSSQSVKKGDLISPFSNPTKKDYTFAGWYTSIEYTNEWNFQKDTVENDMILHAKWNEIKKPDIEDSSGKPGIGTNESASNNDKESSKTDTLPKTGMGDNGPLTNLILIGLGSLIYSFKLDKKKVK